MGRIQALKELQEILAPQTEGAVAVTTTAKVLNMPSSATVAIAQRVVEDLPLQPILYDLGAVCARVIGDELLSRALRPADYADLEELPHELCEILAKTLAQVPEDFVHALVEHLKMRG
jgi:hypothetical protein